MSTTETLPVIAFPDAAKPPTARELKTVLRDAWSRYDVVNEWLSKTYPGAVRTWKHSPLSGWYEIPTVGKRRICYFVPKPGGFSLTVVLGDKAIAAATRSEHGKRVAALVPTAKRYVEGTVFRFDERTFDGRVVVALLAAKMST